MNGAQGATAANESWECGVDGDERLEHQVVAGPQMGAFVAQYRRDFGVTQRRQGALAHHHPAPDSGQTVGQRLGDVDDSNARPMTVITE
jgi:hypothetical protein